MVIAFRTVVRYIVDSAIFLESRLHKSESHNEQRVLIMRKDGLGDCLLFLPFLRYYRERYKGSSITLVFPRYFETLRPLLRGMDEVIWFDHHRYATSFSYRRSFLLRLKRKGFDIAIYPVFTREPAGDMMMRMTGARERISFGPKRNDDAYTKLVEVPSGTTEELARNALFAKEVTGSDVSIVFPTIDTSLLPQKEASILMEKHNLNSERYAILFPGAGAPYRIWPAERFAAVAEHILSKGITPVICGSRQEADLADRITTLMPEEIRSRVIVLSGKTDLAALAHILKGACFYFGSDTGILHLAAAVGTPTIAIVGSGGLDRFFPYGDPSMNKALYDRSIPPTGGVWKGTDNLEPGEPHPSIAGITADSAIKEIDSMLEFCHEKVS